MSNYGDDANFYVYLHSGDGTSYPDYRQICYDVKAGDAIDAFLRSIKASSIIKASFWPYEGIPS